MVGKQVFKMENSSSFHKTHWPGNNGIAFSSVLFTSILTRKSVAFLALAHPTLPSSSGIPLVLFWILYPLRSYTREPARLWAGTMTGTAPIRSSVAWLTVYECVCCGRGFLLTEPLLLDTTCGGDPLLAVTTRVLCGAGARWFPFA